MASQRDDRLPPLMRSQLEQMTKQAPPQLADSFADKFHELFDETYAGFPPEVRSEYEKLLAMPPSTMRDQMLDKLFRIGAGDHDYFDWNGVAVRVACAGGAVETFENGLWRPGGPSRTVRDEECDPLTIEQLHERHPAAARRSRRLT